MKYTRVYNAGSKKIKYGDMVKLYNRPKVGCPRGAICVSSDDIVFLDSQGVLQSMRGQIRYQGMGWK